jgi:uncharacterized protein YcbK (DUF882 family)
VKKYLFLHPFVNCLLAAVLIIFIPARPAGATTLPAPEYRLHLFNINTRKALDIVYRRGGSYVPDALTQLDDYLKDRRTGDIHHYDPRVFDLLHDLGTKLGKFDPEIDILCGYRSPKSNEFLREHRPGVALHSLHMRAMAIDIRMPGVKTKILRDAALSLHRGGVGYYAKSHFVHVDVGRVRRWVG